MRLPSFNQPYWIKDIDDSYYPALPGDMACEVLIVGGGITGITAAALLQLAGKKVAVIDANIIGGGTTGHSTGHLDNNIDHSLTQIIKTFGEDKAQIALHAKRDAINQVEEMNRKFQLKSDFTRIPAYLYAERKEDEYRVEEEFQSAQKLGLLTSLQNSAPLPFSTAKALLFDYQARFFPLAYVRNLARVITEQGGFIYENTRALNAEESDGSIRIRTNQGTITARHVVLAGHTAIFGKATLQARINPRMSYVLAVRVNNQIPDALYWDTDQPYHYTRMAATDDSNVLIIGGADHHTGESDHDTRDSFRQLEQYARERYTVQEVLYHWSHEYFEPPDGLPFIGRLPGSERIYLGAAYSGDGLSFGTAAGMLLSDLILGKSNPAADVFSPSRISLLGSARQMAGGAVEMVKNYAGERLGPGDAESLGDIPREEGRIIKLNGEKSAVYRDAHGELYAVSAVCTHMGCIIHWNSAEKTWDCPCHGSRYNWDGGLISGPAKDPLEPKSIYAEAEK